MRVLSVGAAVCLAAPSWGSPTVTPQPVLDTARAVHDLPLPERMTRISEHFLGLPYLDDPLGEGSGIDPDPLVRYDGFDCLTLIEEVLALSLSTDQAGTDRVRTALRYGTAPVDYANRRHFMELQWIPGNIRDGWLVDTTAQYGEVVRLSRDVTPELWASWSRRSNFALTDEQLPLGTMALNVLPLEAARAIVDQIRPGSIILTVREDRPWVPLWITHVGFVVTKGEIPTMRHATKMGERLSRDHSLSWYLEHIGTYSNWPTLGIAILEPRDPAARHSSASPPN